MKTNVQIVRARTIESEQALTQYVNLIERVGNVSKVRDLLHALNSIENKYFNIDNIISHIKTHL